MGFQGDFSVRRDYLWRRKSRSALLLNYILNIFIHTQTIMKKHLEERLAKVCRALECMRDEVESIGRELRKTLDETDRLCEQRDELARALSDRSAECELYRVEFDKAAGQVRNARRALGGGQQMEFNAPVGQQIANVETLIVQTNGHN